MITPELQNYVQTELAKGAEKNVLMQALLANGWPQEDVEAALDSQPHTETQAVDPLKIDPSTSIAAQVDAFEEKSAKIEMTYDTAVQKVDQLGREQRQVVTNSIKKLEEKKIESIKQRLKRP
jgi:DNA-binding transcriptional MerR regulator